MKNQLLCFLIFVSFNLFSQDKISIEVGGFKTFIEADKDHAWRIFDADLNAYSIETAINARYFSFNIYYISRGGDLSGQDGGGGSGNFYNLNLNLGRLGFGVAPTIRFGDLKYISWQPGFYVETNVHSRLKGEANSFYLELDSVTMSTVNVSSPIDINTIEDKIFQSIDVGLFNSIGFEFPFSKNFSYFFKVKFNQAFRPNWEGRLTSIIDIGVTTGCYFGLKKSNKK